MKKLLLTLGVLAMYGLYGQSNMPAQAWSNGIDIDDDKIRDINFTRNVNLNCFTFWTTSNLPTEFSLKFNQQVLTSKTTEENSVIIPRTCGNLKDFCTEKRDEPSQSNYTELGAYYKDNDSVVSFVSQRVEHQDFFAGVNEYRIEIAEPGETAGYFHTAVFESRKNTYPYFKSFYTDHSTEEGFSLENPGTLLADSIWYCEKFKSETEKVLYIAICKMNYSGPPNSYQSGWVKLRYKDETFSVNCDDSTAYEIEEAYMGPPNTPVIVGLATSYSKQILFDEAYVFPNPASNKITLTNMKDSNVELISSTGELVYVSTIHSDQEEVDVKNQKTGLYILKITKGANIGIRKILIE